MVSSEHVGQGVVKEPLGIKEANEKVVLVESGDKEGRIVLQNPLPRTVDPEQCDTPINSGQAAVVSSKCTQLGPLGLPPSTGKGSSWKRKARAASSKNMTSNERERGAEFVGDVGSKKRNLWKESEYG